MRLSLFLFALCGYSVATPMMHSVGSPAADIRNGTVVGQTKNGVDNFIGIPYVKAPIGNLRYRPPQPIDESFGVLKLPDVAPACFQQAIQKLDATGVDSEAAKVVENFSSTDTYSPQSEDCLTVTVQRPAGTPTDRRLPVLLWIHGGGWVIGASQGYDGTAIVLKSVNMSEPVVFVSLNYRLNVFGFLQGKELQSNGSSNLGLRDQRKAIEWVAENIAAFGGDPDRVTIWGESAGAASVFDHLIINNGDHTHNGKPLFRAAIMNSGTNIRTLSTDSRKAQDVFDRFTASTGCRNTNESGEDVLTCLRHTSTETLTNSMKSLSNFNGVESNNLDMIRRPDYSSDFYSQHGEDAIEKGTYARVPILAGTLEDESTIFSIAQRDIVNSTETLVDYFATWFPEANRQIIADLVATYPDDPAAGLPARTGLQYELYPQNKRMAALQTDLTFSQGRWEVFSQIRAQCSTEELPMWGYLGTFLHGLPQLGTYHTSDLETQFSLEVNKFAANAMDEAYIHFINHLDPNGKLDMTECSAGTAPWWPQWDSESMLLANFSATEVRLTKDDVRRASHQFIKVHAHVLRQ